MGTIIHMNKLLFILLFSIFMNSEAKTQKIVNKILEIVKTNKNVTNIQIVGNEIEILDSNIKKDCSNGKYEIINKDGTIWMTQNGSNKVFKIDSGGKIKRFDRTCNQGFNYGSINIFFKDTLFSFGGYGFWQTTGSVRFFNQNTGEWDIIRNIDDIPIAAGINAISYYDKKNEQLFVIYTPTKPEYVKSKNKKDELLMQCFDMNEKKWWEYPKRINPKIATSFTNLSTIQKYGNGLLLSTKLNEKVILINFHENKVNEIDYKYHTELKQIFNSRSNYISYVINDTTKLIDLNNDKTFNSYISKNQISKYNYPFYIDSIKNNETFETPWLIISGICNCILIIIGLKIYKRKNRLEIFDNESNKTFKIENESRNFKYYIQNLSTTEKDLLHLMYNNQLKKQKTTVTQINKILGTEKKPFKIQNNIRSEILGKINSKFMAFAMVGNNLIERQRSEYDKRHMEYFINEKYLNKISEKVFNL